LLARIGIFWDGPGGVLSTAKRPRPFQLWDPRPPHWPLAHPQPRAYHSLVGPPWVRERIHWPKDRGCGAGAWRVKHSVSARIWPRCTAHGGAI